VNGIDFSVRQGQVFGLLGPNGSGKSTTVKLILGLLYPTRGSLRVFGEDPQNVDMKQRIGYLPEETYLYRYLTAAETLDFFGALFGIPPEERTRRGMQLLEMVGLANSYNRPVGEFSKGMARRIGLAQALVNDPDLVILDEPTSGLDPIGCREVKDVIRLLAQRGKTVIMCSHLLADVQDVCDEVIVLYGGKVRSSGSLADILTVEDRTRIVTPRIEATILDQLKSWLAQHGIADDIRIDHPSMNLEDFFLDVVRQARDASVETAGAQAGGEIAEYLRGAHEEAKPERILEALQAPEEKTPQTTPETEKASEPEQPKVDETKLRKLADRKQPQKDETTEKDNAERDEKDRQASEKLKSLLDNKGAKKE
jgi:ABC-2 type transport system ATP-binding protein